MDAELTGLEDFSPELGGFGGDPLDALFADDAMTLPDEWP